MSSGRSPDLRLELRTRGPVIGALLAWLVLALTAVCYVAMPVLAKLLVCMAILVLGLPVLGTQVFHGFPRRACTLVWSSTGDWHCERGDGSSARLELSPSSRGFSGGALLVFRSREPVRWAFLIAGPDQKNELRRLRVRLVLNRGTGGGS
jgi:hypothetical protein